MGYFNAYATYMLCQAHWPRWTSIGESNWEWVYRWLYQVLHNCNTSGEVTLLSTVQTTFFFFKYLYLHLPDCLKQYHTKPTCDATASHLPILSLWLWCNHTFGGFWTGCALYTGEARNEGTKVWHEAALQSAVLIFPHSLILFTSMNQRRRTQGTSHTRRLILSAPPTRTGWTSWKRSLVWTGRCLDTSSFCFSNGITKHVQCCWIRKAKKIKLRLLGKSHNFFNYSSPRLILQWCARGKLHNKARCTIKRGDLWSKISKWDSKILHN